MRGPVPTFYMGERCGAWQIDGDASKGASSSGCSSRKGADPEVENIAVAGSFRSALGGTDFDYPSGLPLTGIRRASVSTF